MMGNKHKKVWIILNYIEHSLILASAITRQFQFLLLLFCLEFDFSMGITSSAIELKIGAILQELKSISQ